eukprot:13969111-Heterocapsa_arctica.AAC.1
MRSVGRRRPRGPRRRRGQSHTLRLWRPRGPQQFAGRERTSNRPARSMIIRMGPGAHGSVVSRGGITTGSGPRG